MTIVNSHLSGSSVLSTLLADPGAGDIDAPAPDAHATGVASAVAAAIPEALHGVLGQVAGRDGLALLRDMGLHGLMQQSRLAQQPLQARGAGGTQASGSQSTEQVKDLFKQQFAAKAADKEGFHAFMQQVFGDKYDRGLAEQYRQSALAGDFSWLPDVKFVDAGTLGGANGAYNQQEGVVYINRDLAARDPRTAAQTFVEEAGHHLDAKLNTSDTQGDEGEMFRRVIGGERLSQQQVDAIRNENDKGTIVVDGKAVEVEFWGFLEDIGKGIADVATSAVDKAGEVVSDVVDHAGNAARDVVYSLGDAAKEVGMGVIGGAGLFITGIGEGFGGFAINLLNGRIADAWKSATDGLDKAVFQAPRRIFNGALEGVGHWIKTPTYLLPRGLGGDLARNVIDRGVDSVRTIGNAAIDIGRNFGRMALDIGHGILYDTGEALKYWARGDVGEGFKRLGLAFVHPFERIGGTVVDSAMVFGQGVGNVFGNVFGVHEPSRGLNNAERDYLKKLYGDSINLDDVRIHRGNLTHDLGMAPHCVGNDIYLPEDHFNEDGSLNETGMQTLAHEAFHVYQSQHGGNGYIHKALTANAMGIIEEGDRDAGYNFRDAINSGKPFNEWNPEQQGKFFEMIAPWVYARYDSNGDGIADSDYDLNDDGQIQRNELQLAWEDTNRNGVNDNAPAGSPPGTPDPEPTLTVLNDAELARVLAIWDAIKADRPDRTVV
jgi:hypothetical protein